MFSSEGVWGRGSAARRRRWCSWELVIFSVAAGVAAAGGWRRDLTDQVGLESISAGDGLLDVDRKCCRGRRARRRRQRQLVQSGIVGRVLLGHRDFFPLCLCLRW